MLSRKFLKTETRREELSIRLPQMLTFIGRMTNMKQTADAKCSM